QAGANFQGSRTEALGGGGPSAVSQGATYSALAEQVRRLDEIEQARAEHNAQQFQANINLAAGIGATAKSAQASAAVFMEAAQAEEAAAKKAADLRAQINPLEAEMTRLGKQMAEYKQLLNAGVISSGEYEQAQAFAAKRLSDFDMNMRRAAIGGRVLSGELANLGYQVNDVITGLMLGQPVFMIAAQQGGQIYQIFSRSRASAGEMAAAFISSTAAMVTPARVAYTAIGGSIAFATAALISFEEKQTEVQRKLSGMGRASGASVNQIDAIAANDNSGFSTNEARNLAAELASTGKVGVAAIAPIVALGHDFAKTFGVDAAEATKMLADAFSDPVRGADELNKRLGFLDANTKLLIDSLVTQGNRQEAVRVLTDRLRESVAKSADVTGFWSRAWESVTHTVSDFFDQVGRGADRVFAGGADINEKIEGLTLRLLELQKAKLTGGLFDAILNNVWPSQLDEEIAKVTQQLEELRKKRLAIDTAATPETANKQRGLEIDAVARAMLPAIEQTRKLEDQTKALNQAFSDPAIGRWVSVAGTDLVTALERSRAAAEAMRGADPVRNQIADAEAQIRALDARAPAERARQAREAEARRQQLDPNAGTAAERLLKQDQAARLAAGGQTALDNVERQRISTLGGMASVQDVVRSKMLELDNAARDGVSITREQRAAILDLTREQALGITAMKQQADATRIQAETLGMSAGKAAEYSAIQTRLAEAMRNRQVLTEQDIEQIKRQAAALGEVVQAAERARILQDIRFGAQTALLSPEDVQIAQQLKGLYPDVATALSSVEASALRTNNAFSSVSSTMSSGLTTGLVDIVDGTKSIAQGAGDMSKMFIRAIDEMIVKIMIVAPLMKGLQAGFSMLGIGGTGSMNVLPSATGNVFGDNVIPFRNGGAFTNSVVSAPTLFKFANGGAMSLGLMGEAGPEAVMPLRRGSDGRLGVEMAGAPRAANNNFSAAPRVTVINNLGVQSETKTAVGANGDMTVTLNKMMDNAVASSMANGSGQRVLSSQYGVKPFMGS
ncbi:hypothetical protein DYI24_01170, partial [Rhodopseudomonas sp. BR0C11]|uniref:phage tail length tape measure family protein n=1 Tax=Rhodopseudomonas sp. BR0C11 TaxID=2269370 RepID=UPI0019684EFE